MKKIRNLVLGLITTITVLLPTNAFAEGGVWNDEYGEYTYTLTFDFNGGATYDGQGTYSKSGLVSIAPSLNESFLINCFDYNEDLNECHPIDVKKGKNLSYVTVNDERHDLGPDDSFLLDRDTTIVYYWDDMDMENYTLEDNKGNSITFDEEEGHDYNFNVKFLSFSMTDEEIEAIGLTREQYESYKAAVTDAIKEYGDTIAYLEIEVYEHHPCGGGGTDECYDYVHEGPFNVRIKYTDAMAGFNTYKLVFVEIDEITGVVTYEEGIELTLEDGYLVGTVPHLSGYALVGSNTPLSPNTGVSSNISNAISKLPIISVIIAALLTISTFIKKRINYKK